MMKVSFLLEVAVLKCAVIVFLLLIAVQTVASDLIDNQATICPQGFEPSENGSCLLSQPPLDCPTELVLLSLDLNSTDSDNQFGIVDNILYFTAHPIAESDDGRLTIDEAEYILGLSVDNQPLICPNSSISLTLTMFRFFYPPGYSVLTYIGCSLSVIGNFLVLLTYSLFKELRTLPGKILMNLATAILMVDLLILVGDPISQKYDNAYLCAVVAICFRYFFLAQFVWMCIMSIEVVRKFRQARQLTTDSNHSRSTKYLVITYILVGWGLSLLIIVVSVILHFSGKAHEFGLYGILTGNTLTSCYMYPLEEAIIAFALLIFLAILFNLIAFIIATVYICMASRAHKKIQDNRNTRFLRLNFALFSTSGLTWIFGFLAVLFSSWAWYLFIIFNTTQGFIIFTAFLFSKKTLKLYQQLFTTLKERCMSLNQETPLTA